MPLETGTYISDLVTSNPAHSDGLNQADAHARLIKSTLKTTFPNITGAVTATHTQLNSILSQLLGTTAYTAPLGTVSAPGYAFVGDTNTGWYSPAADRAALALGGADALNFAADKTANFGAGASFAGAVSATGPITGPGTIPIGGMIMWTTDTLPSGAGVWCWANGGTLNRTTPGAGKELFDLYTAQLGSGTFYGVGNGTTTFNVINMQEVVPVGKSTMGGASSPGLIGSISAGLKAVLNGLFGNDTHTLAAANVPTLVSTNPSQAISVTSTSNTIAFAGSSQPNAGGANVAILSQGTVTSTGNNSISTTYTNASPSAISNEQPSRAVNFIIRIA